MRRLATFTALWVLMLGVLICASQAQYRGFPPGAFQSRAPLDASGGAPAFAGLFDVAACGSNCDYWGTRAASAADKGNKLMNVCNVADVACADLSSDATTGDLVIGTIGGSSCSIVTCTVKTLYGRGTAFCNGYTTACDLTQATIATRPTLVVNCGGTGKPCLACDGTQHIDNTTVSAFLTSGANAVSISSAAERTGNTSNYGMVIGMNGGTFDFLFNNAANQFIIYAGTVPSGSTANDNTVHSLQGLFNNTSSSQVVDGSASSVNIGANGISTDFQICAGNGASFLTGNFFELAIWPVVKSANFAALYANQKAYWSGIP